MSLKSGTTIAWKNGVLACDKQMTDNGRIMRGACKAVVTADTVYAVTGTITRGLKFIQWLRDGGPDQEEKAPKLKDTVVVAMSMSTGKLTVWESDYPLVVEDAMFATGSGGDIALGAMAHGATPAQAVQYASRWDDGTGGGVQVFKSKRGQRNDKA